MSFHSICPLLRTSSGCGTPRGHCIVSCERLPHDHRSSETSSLSSPLLMCKWMHDFLQYNKCLYGLCASFLCLVSLRVPCLDRKRFNLLEACGLRSKVPDGIHECPLSTTGGVSQAATRKPQPVRHRPRAPVGLGPSLISRL